MAPPAPPKRFDPCREIPADPFQKDLPFCELKVPKASLVKMNDRVCERMTLRGEEGYLCKGRIFSKDQFFPIDFRYRPSLKAEAKANLLFSDGSRMTNILLPRTSFEHAKELVEMIESRDGDESKFDFVLRLIESLPSGPDKDDALKEIAYKAIIKKNPAKAIEVTRKISNLERRAILLAYIATYFNEPQLFDEAFAITFKIENLLKRDSVRLRIAEFRSEKKYFHEAVIDTFYIQDPVRRAEARIHIVRSWRTGQRSPLSSWLLQLAQEDLKSSLRRYPALVAQIDEIKQTTPLPADQALKLGDEKAKQNLGRSPLERLRRARDQMAVIEGFDGKSEVESILDEAIGKLEKKSPALSN